MHIEKINIWNFKSLKNVSVTFNESINIFVGDNDAGKTSILEALNLALTKKINGYYIERQLRASLFNDDERQAYRNAVKTWEDGSKLPIPPQICIEVFFSGGDPTTKGKNNIHNEDSCGVQLLVAFNDELRTLYKQELVNKRIVDIPLDFYKITYIYFSGNPVLKRTATHNCVYVDNTKNDYNHAFAAYMSDNVLEPVSDEKRISLGLLYHKTLSDFMNDNAISTLKEELDKSITLRNEKVGLTLKEETQDEWVHRLSLLIGDKAFDSLGFGSQNLIKIEMSIGRIEENINIVLIEEPENNLSFSNTNRLISIIQGASKSQIFISTHSSLIANKLGLANAILCRNGSLTKFNNLPKCASDYFMKLPTYDTLRMLLAEKVILVEGITDDFIVSRALADAGIEDVHVLAVGSVAFCHYCEMAKLVKKKVVIIRDNDGSISNNIENLYSSYVQEGVVKVYYDCDEQNRTLEISVLKENMEGNEPSEGFRNIIYERKPRYYNDLPADKKYEDVLEFMLGSKSTWSYRVAKSESKIKMPQYILNAINEYN